MKEQKDSRVKIVYYDVEDKIAIENVRAVQEGQYYRIKNVPFFAYNIAYNDLVSIEDDNGELFFDSIIAPSGHSTIQIVIYDEKYSEEITKNIINLQCDWEGFSKVYIAVDVPKEVDYKVVKQYLEKVHLEGKADYKEACLSHQI